MTNQYSTEEDWYQYEIETRCVDLIVHEKLLNGAGKHKIEIPAGFEPQLLQLVEPLAEDYQKEIDRFVDRVGKLEVDSKDYDNFLRNQNPAKRFTQMNDRPPKPLFYAKKVKNLGPRITEAFIQKQNQSELQKAVTKLAENADVTTRALSLILDKLAASDAPAPAKKKAASKTTK